MMESLPAFDLAAHWHADQKRKGCGGEPFVQHPLRVAGTLIQFGLYNPELIQSALLHDILEDTNCPESDIREQVGEKVLAIVGELTDRKELLKHMRKQMQVERAEMLSTEAKLIRLADKIDNMQSMIDDPPLGWSWQRQREYVAWANRVVKRLGPVHPEMENLYWESSESLWRKVTGQDLLVISES